MSSQRTIDQERAAMAWQAIKNVDERSKEFKKAIWTESGRQKWRAWNRAAEEINNWSAMESSYKDVSTKLGLAIVNYLA